MLCDIRSQFWGLFQVFQQLKTPLLFPLNNPGNRSDYVVKIGIMPQFATSDHWQAIGKESLHPAERPHARR